MEENSATRIKLSFFTVIAIIIIVTSDYSYCTVKSLFKESRGIGEILLGKVQDYSDWFDPGYVNAMHNPFFLSFWTMCARQKVM